MRSIGLLCVALLGLGLFGCAGEGGPVDAALPDGDGAAGDDGGIEPCDDGGVEPGDDGGVEPGDGGGAADGGDEAPLSDPAEPGPCDFSSFASEVTSSLDTHAIPVIVYLPSCAGAPFPAAVISHGFQLSAGQYTWLAAHLASHGFAAVLNDFPAPAFPGRDHTEIAHDHADVAHWLRDEADARLAGKIDGERLALVGHSMGGKTSLLAALDNPGLIRAVVGLDPVDAMDPSVAPERMGEWSLPLLLLGETWNGENAVMGQYCAPLEDNYQQYYEAAPAGPAVEEVTFPQAYHMSWLDDPDCGLTCMACTSNPAADHALVRRLSGRLAVAWLQRYLNDRVAAESWLWGADMQAEVAAGNLTFRKKP